MIQIPDIKKYNIIGAAFQVNGNNATVGVPIVGVANSVRLSDHNFGRWANDVAQWRSENCRGDRSHRLSDALMNCKTGVLAEAAAALVFCPLFFEMWSRTATVVPSDNNNRGKNTGNDLRPEWTGMPKPIEVKSTKTGNKQLIVRGSSNNFPTSEVIDSLYVLVTYDKTDGQWTFKFEGWTDKAELCKLHHYNSGNDIFSGWAYRHVDIGELFPMDQLIALAC